MTLLTMFRSILTAALMSLLFVTAGYADAPAICAGPQGFACQEREFCDFTVGTCGAAGRAGGCRPKPDICTREYLPVCGCDDKTYGNDCERRAAGTSKLKDGEC